MINYTTRLDKALRKAAWAHEQANQHRKGTDIPYIIHPVGVMMIAGNVTDDEEILIACLMHDVLEDVDSEIYSEVDMKTEFGDRVVGIVKDVTKDKTTSDWHKCSKAYLKHITEEASDEAIIVCASDKIHNIKSTIIDYQEIGEDVWQRFTTKSKDDQIWWYESTLQAITKRQAPKMLIQNLAALVNELHAII